MNKDQVITSIAGDLYATELAVDAATTQAMTLVGTMIGARAELSFSACAAATAQSKAMEAIAALAVARDAMVACHQEMEKDHRRLGWGVYASGILKVPTTASDENVAATSSHLRAV